MTEFNYNIFGLNFRSPLVIPGLVTNDIGTTDVNIQLGDVPDHLDQVISSGVLFESGPQDFLLKLPNVGKYHVQNGNQITIDPNPGAAESEIRLFLLGSVLGAILFQRGYLPLHGSAIEVDGKALIIIGNSAAGKSTLAASLNQAGFPLISDDLSAISLNNIGKCVIHPGIPFVKLWKDTLDLLFPQAEPEKVRPQLMKYLVPVSDSNMVPGEIILQTIINLTTHNHNEFRTTPITGANKFPVLRDHIYRDQMIKGMGILKAQFVMLSQLANQIQLFQVERPAIPLDVETLTDLVINEIIQI